MIWGSTWLAIRIVVSSVPPCRAAAIRFAAAAVILSAVIVLRRSALPTRDEIRHLAILGVGMMTLPYALLFWAERRISSSTTAVLFSSLPVLTALISPMFLARKVPRRALLGLLFAMGGMLIIFSGALAGNLQTIIGGSAVLLAVLSGALASVLAKARLTHLDPLVSTAFQMGIAAPILLMVSWVLERDQPATWSRPPLLAMGFLVVFGSVVAFSLYYWLLRAIEPYQIATIQLVVPVIAIVEGAVFGREAVSLTMVAAAACILVSVAVTLSAEHDENTMTLFAQEQP